MQKPNEARDMYNPEGRNSPRRPSTTPTGEVEVLSPFLVSLDWLALNMRAHPGTFDVVDPKQWGHDAIDPYTSRVIMQAPSHVTSPQFQCVYYIIRSDTHEKEATIWTTPRSPVIGPAEWIQVQFSNESLYNGTWSTLYRIMRELGADYTGISKVDISCDAIESDGGGFMKVIETAWDQGGKYYGKCDWFPRFERSKITGAEFGKKASNKFIRCYKKAREMKQRKMKPEIVAAWARALGWDPMERGVEVCRFEVSIKGKEIRRHFDERSESFLLELAEPQRRVDVFSNMATDMFDFRTIAARARDAQPLAWWDWSRVQDEEPGAFPRAPRRIALSDHAIKAGIRQIFNLAAITCDVGGLNMAKQYAKAAGPQYVEWYDRKVVEWTKQIQKLSSTGDAHSLRTLEALRAMGSDLFVGDGPVTD